MREWWIDYIEEQAEKGLPMALVLREEVALVRMGM